MSDSPTAAWVDATGIHAPTFTDIRAYLIAAFQDIYGADIVVDNDSQDGQLIGVFALALADANNAAIAAYNSFSPSTASGMGLSRVVKINGLARELPSNSTAELRIIGTAYTVISHGIARDDAGYQWALPASVTIPGSGDITVQGVCVTAGAVTAPANSIDNIVTVTLGWQSVTNPTPASAGAPVEDDPALRQRQATSTALPARSVLDGILGAVLALPGIINGAVYENDTNNDYSGVTPPPAGIGPLPPHSISVVAEGGDPVSICQTILAKKTPGCFTYGSERHSVPDVYGLLHDIGYWIPVDVVIGVRITLKALAGYSSLVGAAISQAMADYIVSLGPGQAVIWSKLWAVADLCPAPAGTPPGWAASYDITSLTIATPVGGTYGTANIPIKIFQTATCVTGNVVVTVA
jgi:uncharacterized phage protein gp47/JayE